MTFLILRFLTGIRRPYLDRLNWEQIDLENQRVIIFEGAVNERKPKAVVLSDNVIEWLKRYKLKRDKGSILALSRGNRNFLGPSRSATHDRVAAAATKAEVRLPPSAGRYTAKQMIEQEHPITFPTWEEQQQLEIELELEGDGCPYVSIINSDGEFIPFGKKDDSRPGQRKKNVIIINPIRVEAIPIQ
jgi:hypothetical protein